jgi:chorismate synthase
MSNNSFGELFKITTWGESHGKGIGVVIDGCPAGLPLDLDLIKQELHLRSPGKNPYVSPRKENDLCEILSGLYEGITTGAPISIAIPNLDVDSSKYEPIKEMLRPGHANYTYLEKYGIYDHRGSGRASARETACRVAAGAVAQQLLNHHGITIYAYIKQIGTISSSPQPDAIKSAHLSPIFCPDPQAEKEMLTLLEEVKRSKDSIGGVVEFTIVGAPAGLGDPIYQKLEAKLASAMMSIPATKGFEIGEGFAAANTRGSLHNDTYRSRGGKIELETNHAGGILAGISTGEPIVGRVAFKPPASIGQPQKTVDLNGKETVMTLPEGSRHDPCVAIRGVPVVKAMAALVVADALLKNQTSRLYSSKFLLNKKG